MRHWQPSWIFYDFFKTLHLPQFPLDHHKNWTESSLDHSIDASLHYLVVVNHTLNCVDGGYIMRVQATDVSSYVVIVANLEDAQGALTVSI